MTLYYLYINNATLFLLYSFWFSFQLKFFVKISFWNVDDSIWTFFLSHSNYLLCMLSIMAFIIAWITYYSEKKKKEIKWSSSRNLEHILDILVFYYVLSYRTDLGWS